MDNHTALPITMNDGCLCNPSAYRYAADQEINSHMFKTISFLARNELCGVAPHVELPKGMFLKNIGLPRLHELTSPTSPDQSLQLKPMIWTFKESDIEDTLDKQMPGRPKQYDIHIQIMGWFRVDKKKLAHSVLNVRVRARVMGFVYEYFMDFKSNEDEVLATKIDFREILPQKSLMSISLTPGFQFIAKANEIIKIITHWRDTFHQPADFFKPNQGVKPVRLPKRRN